MKTIRRKNRSGVALVLVSVSMLAVGVLGAALLAASSAARHQRLYFDVGNRAQYAAESGRSYAYSRRAGNIYYVPVGTFLLDSGDQFTLSSVKVDTNLVVTSTGVAHAGTNRESRQSLTFLLAYNSVLGIEDVFLWAQQMSARGAGTISGPGGTVVITGDVVASDLRGGTDVDVTTIFIEGDALLNAAGNVSLGSSTQPGNIYISGDLELLGGTPTLYGDVHVGKNLRISHGTIHGNMYIHGDVQYVGGGFTLVGGSLIYYAGTLINWPVSGTHAGKAVALAAEEMPTIPEIQGSPKLRAPEWYTGKDYVQSGALVNDLRLYTPTDYSGGANQSRANVVIVSAGDITINMTGQGTLVGVLVAPNGRVTFNGKSFEGLVIAGEGFFVGSGSPDVTFRSITEFFSDPDDYPVILDEEL